MSVRPKCKPFTPATVAVIGLGRFGTALARSLVELGHDVLAIDSDPHNIQLLADEMPHILQADTTDPDALRQIGIADCERVVVGGSISTSVPSAIAARKARGTMRVG